MLCFTLSSIQNWLDFSFKIVSKTTLQWATKASWFRASFFFLRFWINFGFILEASETKNRHDFDSSHWSDGLLTLTQGFFLKFLGILDIGPWPSLNQCSKIDFWSILKPPRRLQGVWRRLKMAPKRDQAPTVHTSHCIVLSSQQTRNRPVIPLTM